MKKWITDDYIKVYKKYKFIRNYYVKFENLILL